MNAVCSHLSMLDEFHTIKKGMFHTDLHLDLHITISSYAGYTDHAFCQTVTELDLNICSFFCFIFANNYQSSNTSYLKKN